MTEGFSETIKLGYSQEPLLQINKLYASYVQHYSCSKCSQLE